MGAQRLIWVLFCLGWAGVWALVAIPTLGVTLIFTAASLLAIALPVGRRRRPRQTGPELADYIEQVLGQQLAPWQRQVVAQYVARQESRP